jgi:hypothetical protein
MQTPQEKYIEYLEKYIKQLESSSVITAKEFTELEEENSRLLKECDSLRMSLLDLQHDYATLSARCGEPKADLLSRVERVESLVFYNLFGE